MDSKRWKGALRRACAAVCSAALCCAVVPASAIAQTDRESYEETVQRIEEQAGAYEDGEMIVVYKKSAAAAQGGLSAQSADAYMLENIPDSQVEVIAPATSSGRGAIAHVDLPEGVSVAQGVASAQQNPAVAYAQPNYTYRLLDERDVPNDPIAQNTTYSTSTPNQWYLESVHAYEAWARAHTDNKVTVAVLDTGINFEHSDLKANINTEYAWNAVTRTHMTESQTDSEMQHGTHVAGIAAAAANNETGIAGVSWNANVLPICVFSLRQTSDGLGALSDDEDIIAAYEYLMSDPEGDGSTVAEATNTHVVNMSLGGYLADDPSYEYDYAFEDIIETAQAEANILTVAAAGNGDGYGNPRSDASYPSDYEAVMSVIALQSDTKRASFSDYNANKNISAPGVSIYSTLLNGDSYGFLSGTSMASPIVAGIAALLWGYNPQLSVADVKEAIYSTAADLGEPGFDPYFGWGRIDAQAALAHLGTAQVTAESTTMVRTQTQTLAASSIADPQSEHSWVWSIDESTPDVATIDAAAGVLTARNVGTVKVNVTASDDATLSGSRSIVVGDIEFASAPTVSADSSANTIHVVWDAASAATSYEVLRATGESDAFQTVGTVAASDAQSYSFIDSDVHPGVRYRYKVMPYGTLDGESVPGVASDDMSCYYTDKSALKANMDAAKELRDATELSTDGATLSSRVYWVTRAERSQLDGVIRAASDIYYSSSATQEKVDAMAARVAQAASTFEAARKPGLIKTIDAADVSVSGGTYTGSAQGRVVVEHDGEMLTAGTDYELVFKDASGMQRDSCVNAGTYTATVTGIAPYSGTVTGEFTIEPADIASAAIAPIADAMYTGRAIEPALGIEFGGAALKLGEDFTVEYANNVNAGSASATITGKGDFTGTAQRSFTIAKGANTISISTAAAVKVGSTQRASTYTRKATSPANNVSYSSTVPYYVKIGASGKATIAKNFTGTARITVRSAATANYAAAKPVSYTLCVKPGKMAIKKLSSVGGGKVKATWTKMTGADEYQVAIAANAKFTKGKKTYTAKGTAASLRTGKLARGKVYYAKIRAYDKQTKSWGAWSAVKKVKVAK